MTVLKPLIIITTLLILSLEVQAQPKILKKVESLLVQAKKHRGDTVQIRILNEALKIAIESNDSYSTGIVHGQLGTYYYLTDPDKCIKHLLKAYNLIKHESPEAAAIFLHTIGFVYDERKNKPINAVKYIEESIIIHQELKDSLEIANMYKYLGVLKSKLGLKKDALENIELAISIYSLKGNDAGIAVSRYDKALVYMNSNNDSAEHYLLLSKEYWLGKNNSRIFGINNTLYKVYFAKKEYTEAKNILDENELILSKTNLYYTHKLEYFNNCKEYYKTTGDITKHDVYVNQHQVLKDSLFSKGVIK